MAAAPVGRITVERDGSVATVTLDAPPVNAFSLARYIEITEVLTELAVDDDLCCVILTATGDRAFSAGLDLHEFLAAPVDQDDERRRGARGTADLARHGASDVLHWGANRRRRGIADRSG